VVRLAARPFPAASVSQAAGNIARQQAGQGASWRLRDAHAPNSGSLHADSFGKLPLRQTTMTANFCQPRSDASISASMGTLTTHSLPASA